MEGEQGISRYTAADAGATVTSKQPSQLWRWSSTFMWSASRVRFLKKRKKEKERKERRKRTGESYFMWERDGMDGFFWWIKLTHSFWEGELLLITGCDVWMCECVCACACVRAKGSATQNERRTVRKRGWHDRNFLFQKEATTFPLKLCRTLSYCSFLLSTYYSPSSTVAVCCKL